MRRRRSVRAGLLLGDCIAHDDALEDNRPQVQFEQNDSPAGSDANTAPLVFATARPPGGKSLLFINSALKRGVGTTYLHSGPTKIQLRDVRLFAAGAMLNWLLVRRESPCRVCTRREAAEGAGARKAPNAQAKGLTRRPSNTGVPHWRETMRLRACASNEIVHRRGKRGRHTGVAISQVKRTARASTRPATGGVTACPRRIPDVR